MNCYLSRNYKGTSSAGNKAKTDIEFIMEEMAFKNVGLKQTTYNQAVLSFLLTLTGVLKAPFCLQKGDILFLQYPLKKYFTLVCNLAHLRGAKVVTVIHDLGSFRRKKLSIEQEIKRLGHSDYIIAHNDKMKQWLLQNGCKAQLGTLELFDYLSATQALHRENTSKPYSILYAGALSPRKNSFLYDMANSLSAAQGPAYRMNLYGSGFEMEKVANPHHLQYMGFVKSDQLIATAQGDFGLVWDGFSTDSCTGNFGEYLQYNNPHKTSLYLRCGLPVIIWSKAALADFITRNEAGFCVDSLKELEEKLHSLSEEQYQKMCNQVKRINQQLAQGHFFKEAASKAIEELKKPYTEKAASTRETYSRA